MFAHARAAWQPRTALIPCNHQALPPLLLCRALYSALESPELTRSTKAPMFLSLLFKVWLSRPAALPCLLCWLAAWRLPVAWVLPCYG